MPTFENALREWVKLYQLTVNEESLDAFYPSERHIIEESLFSLFYEIGTVQYAETGAPPKEYLPSVVNDYLTLLTDKSWQFNCINSNDGWETAEIELLHQSGETYQFHLIDVNNSDWVSGDIALKMQEFSAAKAEQTLLTFYSDDPYVIIRLPHQAAIDLDNLIDKFFEPY
jgi:hypothetical protein